MKILSKFSVMVILLITANTQANFKDKGITKDSLVLTSVQPSYMTMYAGNETKEGHQIYNQIETYFSEYSKLNCEAEFIAGGYLVKQHSGYQYDFIVTCEGILKDELKKYLKGSLYKNLGIHVFFDLYGLN